MAQPETAALFVSRCGMANEQNLRTPSTSEAREMQKLSAKKRSQNVRENKLIRDRILERMGESDWDTMIDNLIERASLDTRSFEVLRDTIGQKPTDKLEADVTQNIIRVTLDD